MKKTDYYKKMQELEMNMSVNNRQGDINRASSVSVGTAFGGTTEISMRAGDKTVWCSMQPVEVIELIHQLAANVGCHLAIKPRKDFSSWRDWKVTEEEKLHYNGWAPFASDMALGQDIGTHRLENLSTPIPQNSLLENLSEQDINNKLVENFNAEIQGENITVSAPAKKPRSTSSKKKN